MTDKICNECAHFADFGSVERHVCARSTKFSKSLVDGGKRLIMPEIGWHRSTCEYQRYEGECGIEGKYWEAKP